MRDGSEDSAEQSVPVPEQDDHRERVRPKRGFVIDRMREIGVRVELGPDGPQVICPRPTSDADSELVRVCCNKFPKMVLAWFLVEEVPENLKPIVRYDSDRLENDEFAVRSISQEQPQKKAPALVIVRDAKNRAIALVCRLDDGQIVRLLSLDDWRTDRSQENPFATLQFFLDQYCHVFESTCRCPPLFTAVFEWLNQKHKLQKRWQRKAREARNLVNRTALSTGYIPASLDEALDLDSFLDWLLDLVNKPSDERAEDWVDRVFDRRDLIRRFEYATMPFWRKEQNADSNRREVPQVTREPNPGRQEFGGEGPPNTTRIIPRWDSTTRALYFGEKIVKKYPKPAENQETILASFEELGWPDSIDDPLNPGKRRDAIRNLNESLGEGSPIRFAGDGTGERIVWKTVPCPELTSSSAPDTDSEVDPKLIIVYADGIEIPF